MPKRFIKWVLWVAVFSSIITIYRTLLFAENTTEDLIDMVILLDRSGSMRKTDPQGLSIPAAVFILEQLALSNDKNRAAVIPFANEAYLLGRQKTEAMGALSSNFPAFTEMLVSSNRKTFDFREISPDDPKKLHQLIKKQMREGGDTELGKALVLSEKILGADETQRRKIVVLISDGKPEPNIRNSARLNEMEPVVGKKLVSRIRKHRSTRDIAVLNSKFGEHLLENTVKNLAEKNIGIYPIAFVREGRDSQVLSRYLEQLKEITTGEKEIIAATENDLIEKLIGFVPSTSSHVQLYAFKGKNRFVKEEQRLRNKEFDLVIPDIAGQVRVFFSFPNSRADHGVQIELFRNAVKVADSQLPQSSGVVFNRLKKRDGSLAYYSFKFIDRANAVGKWRIVLTDTSRAGSERLPDTDLLVDIRSEAELEIGLRETGPLLAEKTLTFTFSMFARKEKEEYTLPIKRIDAFVIGRTPEEIRHFSTRLRVFDLSEKVALAKWEQGFPESGIYRFRGRVFFDTIPETTELQTLFDMMFKVAPAEPYDAWFGQKGRSPSLFERNAELKFELPSIGEQFRIEFKSVQVETVDNRTSNSLMLTMDPFQHPETSAVLSSDWVTLFPKKLRGLSNNRPASLRLKIELPESIPPRISDGVYRSYLYLKNGITILDQVPVFLGVTIPRFVLNRDKANNPYLEEDERHFSFEQTISYPGEIAHPFLIPIWSTSIPGATATPTIEIQKALAFEDTEEYSSDLGRKRFDHVLFRSDRNEFFIPGKNNKNPGIIKANVILSDPSLNGRSFENTMILEAEHHRKKSFRLITHIRFIEKWKIYAVATTVLIVGLLFGFLWYNRWLSNYKLFDGYEYDSAGVDLDLPHYIRYKNMPIGQFKFEKGDEKGKLTFTGNVAVIHNDSDDSYSPDEPINLDENDTLLVPNAGGKQFTIGIGYISENEYSYSILSSDLNSLLRFLFIVPALSMVFLSLYVFLQPYGLFQVFKI